MPSTLSANEEAQLLQTIEMFEVITQSQPLDYQSLDILKEAYFKLGRQQDVVNTSKRIADAYKQLGQLSSAILEYESVLQLFPDDPDVQNALADIENRANNFTPPANQAEAEVIDRARTAGPKPPAGTPRPAPAEIDDGRKAMEKLFVEGKLISEVDFKECWVTPSFEGTPPKAVEPFLQIAADRGILPLEQSLKVLCDKSRLSFLPIEKYDVDVELARTFPKDVCRRWCVLPFDRMSKSVLVATANPFNKQASRELEGAGAHRLVWYLASPSELVHTVNKIFR